MARADRVIVGVVLVDPVGRILLQLRDGHTAIDPHCWCPPGGAVEPGEEPATAALRELWEETGLRPEDGLRLAWRGQAPSAHEPDGVAEYHVFVGRTRAGQHEVRCGEGAAMVFTPAAQLPWLPMGRAYREILPAVLASPEYAAVAGDAKVAHQLVDPVD